MQKMPGTEKVLSTQAIFVVQDARHNAGGLPCVRGSWERGLRSNDLCSVTSTAWEGRTAARVCLICPLPLLLHFCWTVWKWVSDVTTRHAWILLLVSPKNKGILCNDNIISRDWYSNQIQTAQLSKKCLFYMCVYTHTRVYLFLFVFEILEPLRDHPLRVVTVAL